MATAPTAALKHAAAAAVVDAVRIDAIYAHAATIGARILLWT